MYRVLRRWRDYRRKGKLSSSQIITICLDKTTGSVRHSAPLLPKKSGACDTYCNILWRRHMVFSSIISLSVRSCWPQCCSKMLLGGEYTGSRAYYAQSDSILNKHNVLKSGYTVKTIARARIFKHFEITHGLKEWVQGFQKKVCGYFLYKIKCRLLDLLLIFSKPFTQNSL